MGIAELQAQKVELEAQMRAVQREIVDREGVLDQRVFRALLLERGIKQEYDALRAQFAEAVLIWT